MSSRYTVLLILFFTLLLPIVAAVQMPDAFVPYLEPNLSADAGALNTSGGATYILSIQGQETLMVREGSNELLNDPAAIAAALKEDIVQNSGYLSARQDAQSSLASLQTARQEPEANCTRLTGMDRFPCTDRDSCVKAAFANPLSADYVNAAGFWQAMLRWQTERNDTNASLNDLQAAQSTPTNDSQAARAIADKMNAMRDKMAFFLNNSLYRAQPKCNTQLPECKQQIADYCNTDNLFTCFEYCPLIPFDPDHWKALEERMRTSSDAMKALANQDSRAQTIAQREAQWVNYTQTKGSVWNQMKSALSSKQTELEARMKNSSGLWNDSKLSKRLAGWEEKITDAKALADGGQFFKALAMKDSLGKEGDDLGAAVTVNDRHLININNSLKSSQLAIDSLAKNGTTPESESLSKAQGDLKAELKYPITAERLASLEDQASKLEQQALAEVARAALGVLPRNDTNGTAGTGSPTGEKTVSLKLPANCPLPIGLALGTLAIALALGIAKPEWESD